MCGFNVIRMLAFSTCGVLAAAVINIGFVQDAFAGLSYKELKRIVHNSLKNEEVAIIPPFFKENSEKQTYQYFLGRARVERTGNEELDPMQQIVNAQLAIELIHKYRVDSEEDDWWTP